MAGVGFESTLSIHLFVCRLDYLVLFWFANLAAVGLGQGRWAAGQGPGRGLKSGGGQSDSLEAPGRRHRCDRGQLGDFAKYFWNVLKRDSVLHSAPDPRPLAIPMRHEQVGNAHWDTPSRKSDGSFASIALLEALAARALRQGLPAAMQFNDLDPLALVQPGLLTR